MVNKSIELEIRAKVTLGQFTPLAKKLSRLAKKQEKVRRLSVMYFGKTNGTNRDLRVRVTNGQCEVVLKSGDFHADDRREVEQQITKDEFAGLAHIFCDLGFEAEAGEREITNYYLPGRVTASLGKAKSVCYLELEIMTDKASYQKDKKKLEALAKELKVEIIGKKGFYELCERLNKEVDWKFTGSRKDLNKLSKILKNY